MQALYKHWSDPGLQVITRNSLMSLQKNTSVAEAHYAAPQLGLRDELSARIPCCRNRQPRTSKKSPAVSKRMLNAGSSSASTSAPAAAAAAAGSPLSQGSAGAGSTANAHVLHF